MSEEIEAEVSGILAAGGFTPMPGPPFTGLLCKEVGGGYWMGGVFEPIPGDVDSFHTHMKEPPDDPIEAARRIVAHKHAKLAGMRPAAVARVVDTFEAMPEARIAEIKGETMPQSININVAPVFNVGGSSATSDADSGVDNEAHGEADATRAVSSGDAMAPDQVGDEFFPPTDSAGIAGSSVGESVGEAISATESLTDEIPEPPESEPADPSPEALADTVDSGADVAAHDEAEAVGDADGGTAIQRGQVHDEPGLEGAGDSDLPYATDAEFEEIGDETDELALLEAANDTVAPPVEHDRAFEDSSGGVVYFGDDIHVARLAKMGRLAEIARERKLALQDGWTVSEYASLQNLMVRIERSEAPDDQEARARFLAINERSRAMSTIDAFQNQREDELESYAELMKAEDTRELGRVSILDFNPEAGWPT